MEIEHKAVNRSECEEINSGCFELYPDYHDGKRLNYVTELLKIPKEVFPSLYSSIFSDSENIMWQLLPLLGEFKVTFSLALTLSEEGISDIQQRVFTDQVVISPHTLVETHEQMRSFLLKCLDSYERFNSTMSIYVNGLQIEVITINATIY